MLKNKSLYSLILVSLSVPALADTPPAAPAGPTLSSILDASGVSLSGDVDVSYNHLSGAGKFTNGTNDRVFDYTPNGFTTQAVDLQVAKQPAEGAGGLVDLTLGKDASTIASFGTFPINQTYDLTQAYVQYTTGSLTGIAGKFTTLAGEEVIKASGNTNFSRSILFGYAIPFTHTGVRVTYKASDAFSLIGGVNNGWDQATDTNPNKTIELGVALNPSKFFALTAQDYYGVEQVTNPALPGIPGPQAQGKRNLLDLVATFTVSDSLNFVLNPDFGSQENGKEALGSTGNATWSGVAAYANYQINDPWRLSLRVETFNDKDGYRTNFVGGQKWNEATLTVGYAASKSMELRGEVRKDTSDKASFADNSGNGHKSQNSLGLEAVYKF